MRSAGWLASEAANSSRPRRMVFSSTPVISNKRRSAPWPSRCDSTARYQRRCCSSNRLSSRFIWRWYSTSRCSSPEPHTAHWQTRTTPVATLGCSSLPMTTTAAPTLLPTALVPEEVDKNRRLFLYTPLETQKSSPSRGGNANRRGLVRGISRQFVVCTSHERAGQARRDMRPQRSVQSIRQPTLRHETEQLDHEEGLVDVCPVRHERAAAAAGPGATTPRPPTRVRLPWRPEPPVGFPQAWRPGFARIASDGDNSALADEVGLRRAGFGVLLQATEALAPGKRRRRHLRIVSSKPGVHEQHPGASVCRGVGEFPPNLGADPVGRKALRAPDHPRGGRLVDAEIERQRCGGKRRLDHATDTRRNLDGIGPPAREAGLGGQGVNNRLPGGGASSRITMSGMSKVSSHFSAH